MDRRSTNPGGAGAGRAVGYQSPLAAQELDGEDYRSKPLVERKKKLFKLIRRAWGGIEYVEHLEGDGAMIFEHACKLGLEGIVCKRVDLPYRPGPSKSWIKVKNKKHPAMLRVKEAFELERQR
jgi:ATP-dependent DNA ligase